MRDPDALIERAPAKINLTLHVGARRGDGYHELESLVVFAREHDVLHLTPGDTLALTADGATATAAGPASENLVLQAARALTRVLPGLASGHFSLTKNLPVAAGLGGGSSDAAAALRLLAKANGLAADDPALRAAAAAVGADVPVCLDPRPRIMRGAGELLSAPLALLPLQAVLVHPGVALPTGDVFAAFDRTGGAKADSHPDADLPVFFNTENLLAYLAARRNDLEPAAKLLQPVIDETLAALRAQPGCLLARMSGSGATCFGLFMAADGAKQAAQVLGRQHPGWWVRETALAELGEA